MKTVDEHIAQAVSRTMAELRQKIPCRRGHVGRWRVNSQGNRICRACADQANAAYKKRIAMRAGRYE